MKDDKDVSSVFPFSSIDGWHVSTWTTIFSCPLHIFLFIFDFMSFDPQDFQLLWDGGETTPVRVVASRKKGLTAMKLELFSWSSLWSAWAMVRIMECCLLDVQQKGFAIECSDQNNDDNKDCPGSESNALPYFGEALFEQVLPQWAATRRTLRNGNLTSVFGGYGSTNVQRKIKNDEVWEAHFVLIHTEKRKRKRKRKAMSWEDQLAQLASLSSIPSPAIDSLRKWGFLQCRRSGITICQCKRNVQSRLTCRTKCFDHVKSTILFS